MATHNMVMETVILRDGAVDNKLFPNLKMPKDFEIYVGLPVAQSVSNVEKGEVWTLPFMEQFVGAE